MNCNTMCKVEVVYTLVKIEKYTNSECEQYARHFVENLPSKSD